MGFMGKNIRRVILETAGTVGEKDCISKYLENLISGEEIYIHINLTNNRKTVWENQTTFEKLYDSW
jgi:hypothetical protein